MGYFSVLCISPVLLGCIIGYTREAERGEMRKSGGQGSVRSYYKGMTDHLGMLYMGFPYGFVKGLPLGGRVSANR